MPAAGASRPARRRGRARRGRRVRSAGWPVRPSSPRQWDPQAEAHRVPPERGERGRAGTRACEGRGMWGAGVRGAGVLGARACVRERSVAERPGRAGPGGGDGLCHVACGAVR
ncbi:hypothetical protein KCH_69230 [Kitasatospora cheerisanensis KCTC 2395]|uniref:Uncharacterized protein n=1 Tax=Kitasatospora cheerisanensis KCTC 2395 TaxID=1348663 RepID=A0A066YT79_9ACTN|nr:hypothetical protein KCH_69230 [Kitasatospora cheerisanensis KCTC 2395]